VQSHILTVDRRSAEQKFKKHVAKEEQEWDEEIERMEIFIQKGMKLRLGFGETNKKKGSSKKPNLKEKTPSLILGFARLEQLEG
jgi:hypothetical protein